MSSPWIVIPTYNERENIKRLIPELFSLSIPNLQVLIVDDNSPDGTSTKVHELQKEYPTLHLETGKEKQGLGRAYREGFLYALQNGADKIVQMDADFSHDPHDVPKLLNELAQKDVVIGSRYVNGISVINWPLRRLLISAAGNAYARIVTGMPYKDVTGGFRAWRAAALRGLDLRKVNADGYGFQVEMLYFAWKKKYTISEVPIIFTERRAGNSKMSNAIIIEAMILVWKLRLFG